MLFVSIRLTIMKHILVIHVYGINLRQIRRLIHVKARNTVIYTTLWKDYFMNAFINASNSALWILNASLTHYVSKTMLNVYKVLFMKALYLECNK